jgi:hypothetical protein
VRLFFFTPLAKPSRNLFDNNVLFLNPQIAQSFTTESAVSYTVAAHSGKKYNALEVNDSLVKALGDETLQEIGRELVKEEKPLSGNAQSHQASRTKSQ